MCRRIIVAMFLLFTSCGFVGAAQDLETEIGFQAAEVIGAENWRHLRLVLRKHVAAYSESQLAALRDALRSLGPFGVRSTLTRMLRDFGNDRGRLSLALENAIRSGNPTIDATRFGSGGGLKPSRVFPDNRSQLRRMKRNADVLIVVTHKDNPINSLSVDDIIGIFRGKYENWSEFGGPDRKITPLVWYHDLPGIGGMLESSPGDNVLRVPFAGLILPRVDRNPDSIGFVRVRSARQLGFIANHADLKKISLQSADGAAPVEPSQRNVETGEYPFVAANFSAIRTAINR